MLHLFFILHLSNFTDFLSIFANLHITIGNTSFVPFVMPAPLF